MTNAAIEIITPRTIARAAQPQKAKHGEGSVLWRRGKAQVRLSLGPLGRRAFPLPPSMGEREAEERRGVMAEMARQLCESGQIGVGLPLLQRAAQAADAKTVKAIVDLSRKVARGEAVMKPSSTTTIRELGERWTSGELARLYRGRIEPRKNAKADAGCLALHVYPVAGNVAVDGFTRDHADQIMARIPAARADNTVRNVALTLHRLLAIAVSPLRLIPSNPLGEGFIPRPGARKAQVYVYPDEDRALLGCVDIPLRRRVFYGFLAREGMRAGEALSLRWVHLDLSRGTVRLDANKTDDPRTWALNPSVVRALVAWRSICEEATGKDSALVFPRIDRFDAAHVFRADLRLAGIARPELYEKSPARKPICVHDLRATFVSLSLADGKTESWVRARTGHRSSQMLARYERTKGTIEELNLGALAPLDEAIPELRGSPREPNGGRGNGAAGRASGDADQGPENAGPGSGDRSGSGVPKAVPEGREPSGEIRNPAEIATSRDAPDAGGGFVNRRSRVQVSKVAPASKPAKLGQKAPPAERPAEAQEAPADPIRIQSAPMEGAAPGTDRPVPPAARVAMVRELSTGLADSFAAGDVAAVKVALDAIGRLVAP